MSRTYTVDIDVRFRDVDPLEHVSHTLFVTYMQQARLEYFYDILDLETAGIDTVVAHLDIDYLNEITRGDDVTVAVTVSDIGTTSFATDYEIRTQNGVVATGTTVQVVVDSDSGKSKVVPDGIRGRLERYRADTPG